MIGLLGHPIAFRVDEAAPIWSDGRGGDLHTHKGSDERMRGKPNYRFGRTERDRAKKAKREDKLKSRQERAALREPEVSPTPREDGEPAPE